MPVVAFYQTTQDFFKQGDLRQIYERGREKRHTRSVRASSVLSLTNLSYDSNKFALNKIIH